MGQRKLFRIVDGTVHEIESSLAVLESNLQKLFERHLHEMLGIRVLKTEYATNRDHGGRMDMVGLDENGFPTIIEFKRGKDDNVILQILAYHDWLFRNRDAFELLVMKKLGAEAAGAIDFAGTRLLCIASEFSKRDLQAVNHVNPKVELIGYRHYGDDLLLLDYITDVRQPTKAVRVPVPEIDGEHVSAPEPTALVQNLTKADAALAALFESVQERILAFGEDVQVVDLQQYRAFKRIKNFACVLVQPGKGALTLYLRLDPDTVQLEPGFTRDMRGKGHQGTGDVEAVVRTEGDVERLMPLLQRAYEGA